MSPSFLDIQKGGYTAAHACHVARALLAGIVQKCFYKKAVMGFEPGPLVAAPFEPPPVPADARLANKVGGLEDATTELRALPEVAALIMAPALLLPLPEIALLMAVVLLTVFLNYFLPHSPQK